MGDGCRYGADFVAYEQDPDLCHSFAAVVVRTRQWGLSMPQLAGLTRMQNVVRKAAVFAFVDGIEGSEDAPTAASSEEASDSKRFGVDISDFVISYTSSSFLGVI